MKNLLLLFGTFLLSFSVFGQGQVVLANLGGSIDAPIGLDLGNGTIVNPGPGARAQLYLADSNTPLLPMTTFLDFPGFERYMIQVTITVPNNPGITVNMKVVAWMVTGPGAGPTFETALSRGESNVIPVRPDTPTIPPADLNGLQSFNIILVPEPSKLSLLSVGAICLFSLRRLIRRTLTNPNR